MARGSGREVHLSNQRLHMLADRATVLCNQRLREGDEMEYGSIEREIHIDAAPEVVYEVISTPAHLREWWPDEAELEPLPGATGVISFGNRSEEHTSELQSLRHLVCRLLLEKKNVVN